VDPVRVGRGEIRARVAVHGTNIEALTSPTTTDRLGQSALEKLDLPAGVAPAVEQQLAVIAEQLRPACSLSTRSFRVLLAHYADVHSFSMPPDAVIITAGFVCRADDPNLVTAAVARELAHLENRDVRHGVAEAVDWHTPLDLALGDVTRLRERMLDFADPKRSPGFTTEQDTAASERALFLMTRVGVHLEAGQDLAALMGRLRQSPGGRGRRKGAARRGQGQRRDARLGEGAC